ncbi:chromophore lyase CpcT/CpeT [uncultured Croceitalea sp.]|uniref:chromophore lyase CpcT/CpeT n=1 Tax=uncultured Croceitalea sp. TaxID=1798908 RepID=UPI003305881E
MNKTSQKLFYVLLLVIAIVACKEQKKTETPEKVETEVKVATTAEEQLTEIMSFWPGKYNNDRQIEEAKNRGEAIWLLDNTGKDGWLQIESHYIKVDNPAIGKNVLYVEEYRDHQPDSIYRQRIYTLDIDSTKTIRVKMWPFKDKKKYVGAWKNPKVLANLSVEEINGYPDKCDLIVKKDGDAYDMNMNGKDCAFGNSVFNYQVRLTKDVFAYRDKITKLDTDELLSTAANYAYHSLDKIK